MKERKQFLVFFCTCHLCCVLHVSLSVLVSRLLFSATDTVSLILTPLHHLCRLLFALTFFLLTSPHCRLFVFSVSCWFVPLLGTNQQRTTVGLSPVLLTCRARPLHCPRSAYVSSDSRASSLGESSLIVGVSADRLTNSLFINGLSVPGSQRSQRII